MESESKDVSVLLDGLRNGDPAAKDKLIPLFTPSSAGLRIGRWRTSVQITHLRLRRLSTRFIFGWWSARSSRARTVTHFSHWPPK